MPSGDIVEASAIFCDKVIVFFSAISIFSDKICTEDFKLDIIGLMCLPPQNLNTENYFLEMLNLSKKIKLNDLSMGMSSDYMAAVKYKSTFLRIGSKIFGKRD